MVQYTEPSPLQLMLNINLAAEGLALELGRHRPLIFSLNYTDADFTEVEPTACRGPPRR
jgi:hypothetical protein